jgi:peroxiredoxin Q/BCP
VGVSADSRKSHLNFREKHELQIILLSDPEHEVISLYDCWRMKNMYGREFMGIIRSTFLIDPQGRIVWIWDNVKTKGHAEKVLAKLAEFIQK